MAAPDTTGMRRLKGNIVANSVGGTYDFTAAYPYGGTELGFCRSATFLFGIRYTPIMAEEFGGASVEYLYNTESAIFSAVMRDYDDDMIQALFLNRDPGKNPSGSKATQTGKPLINARITGTVRSGQSVSRSNAGGVDKCIQLLFVPEDRENHEFLRIYNALPMVHEGAEMRMTAADWAEIGLTFQALPWTGGVLYQFGRKLDL